MLAQADLTQPMSAVAPRRPAAGVREYRSAYCPVCGVTHGKKRLQYPAPGVYIAPPTMNYWEWLAHRKEELGIADDLAFGVIQEVGLGKGHGFNKVGQFDPSDDPDGYYPWVKTNLLLGLRAWLRNGWLRPEEVEALLVEPKQT